MPALPQLRYYQKLSTYLVNPRVFAPEGWSPHQPPLYFQPFVKRLFSRLPTAMEKCWHNICTALAVQISHPPNNVTHVGQ